MAEQPFPCQPERIKMAAACVITGLGPRRMQQMAERGEIPGTVKIGGLWVFHEAKLRAWLSELEESQCRTRKILGAARPRRTPSGAAQRSTVASGSKAGSGAGRYERAMSSLLAPASPRTSRG